MCSSERMLIMCGYDDYDREVDDAIRGKTLRHVPKTKHIYI